MTIRFVSAAGSCPKQIQQAPTYHSLFTDGYQVGVLDYLRHFQCIPLATLDIDRFIYTTITNPAHPHAWNAGYLAGWLAGMAAVEGTTDYIVAQVHDVGGENASLHLVEVTS